jgi:hypothetical protein
VPKATREKSRPPFLVVGPTLKASATEPEFSVLFERPVPDGERGLVSERLPPSVTTSLGWAGRLLTFAGDLSFRPMLRSAFGKAATPALDAALEQWARETHAAYAIVCFHSLDGKGANVERKDIGHEVAERIVPTLLEHFDEEPGDTRAAWLLVHLLDAVCAAKKLDVDTFVTLDHAVARAVERCDAHGLLYLLSAHHELVERAPEGAVERVGHRPAFVLAALLQRSSGLSRDELVERTRLLACDVDDTGARLVARTAAWLLGGGPGLAVERKVAIAEALLEGSAIAARRADDVSLGLVLAACALSLIAPFGMLPRESPHLPQAASILTLALRFADAPPEAQTALQALGDSRPNDAYDALIRR